MKISGIYKIESRKKPTRIYIGSSCNISKRWISHINRLRGYKHKNSKLQSHYNKYGEADLIFSILLGCDEEDLLKTEQYFIDFYKPWFNINILATSRFGAKISEESKEKIRQVNIGRKHSPETKRKMSETHKRIGTKPPAPWGRIPWNKGKIGVSDETSKKLSEAVTKIWEERNKNK